MANSQTPRTKEKKAKQKIRSDNNKLKPAKPRKFASEALKAKKLQIKEVKKQKFLTRTNK